MPDNNHSNTSGLEIAVIGMACRFPGAKNIDEFWNNLVQGEESITFFTDEELMEAGVEEELLKNPNVVKAKGIIEGIELFDPYFFGFTPLEAEVLDPQVRFFCEVTWEALENAGYASDTHEKTIGVYAGAATNLFWEGRILFSEKINLMGQFAAWHLYDKDFMSTQVSYRLNLKGPSMTLNTACSTSMVAIDQASRALITGQCELAIAGGVALKSLDKGDHMYVYEEGMHRSPDGHCRAFDAKSKGVVFSDGVGIVVLKSLEEALEDQDYIYAVIKGSAVNNDGVAKKSFSAPSIDGQAEVIRMALYLSGVESETIGYVETHGTGTILGDPIEVEALRQAFNTDKKGYCPIGSVKTNVGHLDIAAGIVGFIKTVLSLKNKQIPPSLHFETPNPNIDFEKTPFYVNTELQEWKKQEYPRRAGVSSFGVGGTNAHAILEEAPALENTEQQKEDHPHKLILLTARTEEVLEKITDQMKQYLEQHPGINMKDVAYTLQEGRKSFKYRRMLLCKDSIEAVKKLNSLEEPSKGNQEVFDQVVENSEPPVVFMFPGQGSQYLEMGLKLYQTQPQFRQQMDECFQILESLMKIPVKELLYPNQSQNTHESNWDINDTRIAQPLIFVFEYSLAKLLIHWGIQPRAMIGHSIGEYVAACLAGVFNLQQALELVVLRGKLMQQMPEGTMLSVPLSEDQLVPLLEEELSIAAINSPRTTVVSGDIEDIQAFDQKLKKMGHQTRVLHTSHAYHSQMMEPVLEEFQKQAGRVVMEKPKIPYISNLTGGWVQAKEATDPMFWTRHIRETVRFSQGLRELLQEIKGIYLEVGPGKTLMTFFNQHHHKKPGQKAMNLVRHPEEEKDDMEHLLLAMGNLWSHGKSINWRELYSQHPPRRVPLPTYPFEKHRCWVEDSIFGTTPGNMNKRTTGFNKTELQHWFYTPSWKRTAPEMGKKGESDDPMNWLLFSDDLGIGEQLVKSLENQIQKVIQVRKGSEYRTLKEGSFYIRPHQKEDYQKLFQELEEKKYRFHRIVHAWNVTNPEEPIQIQEEQIRISKTGFYSLLYLGQALTEKSLEKELHIKVITSNLFEVTGNEIQQIEKALITGPVSILPLENPQIITSTIDIQHTEPGTPGEAELNQQLMAEILSDSPGRYVALRGRHRWVQTYEPVKLENRQEEQPMLKQEGVYLITGGMGGMGMVLAEHLASKVQAKLVLITRSEFPPRHQWQEWLENHPYPEITGTRINKILQLEKIGSEVWVYSVDVTNYKQMKRVISEVGENIGKINGVIHAAGKPGAGLIQLKTREAAEEVLSSKVEGTLILDELFKDNTLDFMMLCSSINSVLPRVGQVDYYSANAFLDAFATNRTTRGRGYTVSINWDSWKEVGMALEAARKQSGLQEKERTGEKLTKTYHSRYNLKDHWVLNEHKITMTNEGLLPGVVYLEMVREIMDKEYSIQTLELRDVYFLNSLIIREDQEREVRIQLKEQEQGFQFTIQSRQIGEEANWQKHARGTVVPLIKPEPYQQELQTLKQGLTEDESISIQRSIEPKAGLLSFGPRWKSIQKEYLDKERGLAFIELDERFQEDFKTYQLHPALTDLATGFLYGKINPGHSYIPFSYKRIQVKAPLPSRIYSYNQLKSVSNTQKDMLKFDISIYNEEGMELVKIEEFSMLKVSEEVQKRIRDIDKPVKETQEPETEVSEPLTEVEVALKNAITNKEGLEIFDRILGTPMPQVVVSTTDLRFRLDQFNSKEKILQQQREKKKTETGLQRPELSSKYQEPANETEKKLAAIWSEFLGVKQLGVQDDFFELGGDSLRAINIGGKIQAEMDREVPLTEFFKRPTIKKLSEYLNQQSSAAHDTSLRITEKREYYPLSKAQRRLFILNQLENTNTGYNLSGAFLLTGECNQEKLTWVFNKLNQRHENFRTTFHLKNGAPVQRIHEKGVLELTILGKDTLVEEQETSSILKSTRIQEIMDEFIQPFNLSRLPLFRVLLIELGNQESIIMMDTHHIVYDGTSMVLFLQEIIFLYEDEYLVPLPLQYKDVAAWENTEKRKEDFKKQESFWLTQYREESPVLDLPLDNPRPLEQSYKGETQSFRMDHSMTNALKNLAIKQEVTLFVLLLSIFYVFISRLSNQEDIVVGTPISNRKHPETQQLIGLFVNTLALRNRPKGNQTFGEFLKEVKNNTMEAFDNQDYPFEDLVEKTNVQRDMSRNPLFDVMLIQHTQFLSVEIPEIKSSNLQIESLLHRKKNTTYDMTVSIFDRHHLTVDMEYSTALFNSESINRFICYFKKIIEQTIGDPGREISTFEILEPWEKEQLIQDFNNTDWDISSEYTILQGMEKQAKEKQGKCILSFQDKQLTFQAFNERTSQIANKLGKEGVKSGNIVGLLVERSLELITGMVGIMKSGAAYLPIDPQYPLNRIQYMLKDSGADTIVVTPGLKLRPLAGTIIDLNDSYPAFEEIQVPEINIKTEDLLYVIYTSGTTGKPKAVMIEHKSMINFIQGIIREIPVQEEDRILSLTTVSFDIFGLESILPLTQGTHITIGDAEEQLNVSAAARKMEKEKITLFQLTPTRLFLFLEHPEPTRVLNQLHTLLVTGEEFPEHLHEKIKKLISGRIINLYGPTETTIWSTLKDVTGRETLNIGKPISNTRITILDKYKRLQPIGITGDIYISGQGISRGYLNQLELTGERFITHSFDKEKEEVLYKTGDLGRWLTDGNIEYQGRQDTQVKIRGFRIELKEIETVIQSHPGIKDVVVLDKEKEPGQKNLCAYLVKAEPVEEEELRDWISERCPYYMVPTYFMELEMIPLTLNGKTDKHALPIPVINPIKTYVEPQTDKEKKIANLLKVILKIEKVGIYDNFFQLGGNSLDLLMFQTQLNKELNLEVPAVSLFQYPTIHALFQHIFGQEIEVKSEEIDESRMLMEKDSMEETIHLFEEVKNK